MYGRRGQFVISLHALLLGYLLVNVAFLKASGRSRKTSLTIYPRCRDLVQQLLDEFETNVAKYAGTAWVEPTVSDRAQFNLSDEEWNRFLRRMGFDGDGREKDGK
jgi:hypothetical protein